MLGLWNISFWQKLTELHTKMTIDENRNPATMSLGLQDLRTWESSPIFAAKWQSHVSYTFWEHGRARGGGRWFSLAFCLFNSLWYLQFPCKSTKDKEVSGETMLLVGSFHYGSNTRVWEEKVLLKKSQTGESLGVEGSGTVTWKESYNGIVFGY